MQIKRTNDWTETIYHKIIVEVNKSISRKSISLLQHHSGLDVQSDINNKIEIRRKYNISSLMLFLSRQNSKILYQRNTAKIYKF